MKLIDINRRRQQVRDMTRAGMTAAAIASRLGVTERTVQRDRGIVGVAQRSTSVEVTPAMLTRIEELLDDGCSALEAARTVRCSQTQVLARFPGRGWSRDQIVQHALVVRRAS